MAAENGPYLPDLERCLSGDVLLLSWDDVLNSLLSHDTTPSTPRASFFADQPVKTLLSQPIPAFALPSAGSKSAFETRTAAINIAPSPSSQYDIQKIKSDALWLSKELQIDELEALRLTVLEWQYQPEARLKSGFSDAELATLRDGLGTDYVESMGLVPGGSLSRTDAVFDSPDALRVRLLQLAFSEQVRLLLTASEIIQQSLLSSERAEPTHNDLWQPIMKVLTPMPAKSLLDHIESTENSIKDRLDSLNSQQTWSVDERYHPLLTEDRATSTLRAIAVILELLLLQIKKAEEPITAEPLQTWLRFMGSVEYFSPFQSDVLSQREAIDSIQCTASSITLALLDPASTFASLSQDRILESSSISGERDWFIDKDNINDIHHYLFAAAESCNIQASLAVATWSLVLLEIRTLANAAKEIREARLVQRGVDKSLQEHSNRRLSSSSTGSTQSTIYEDIVNEIMTTNKVDDPVDYMLQHATHGAKVFHQFDRICSYSKQSTSIISSVLLQLLQEWIRVVRPSLGYCPELVSAQLNLLSRSPSASSNRALAFNPIANFVGDDALRQDFFDVAASRFPYESLPFLRMCRALAAFETTDIDGTNYITFRLRELQSFTQAAIGGFASYKTYREDENANLVSLDYGVGMLDFQPNRFLTTGNSVQYLNVIPAQTIGEVIKETRPPVIRWQYSFPGLSLLGKWLELYLEGTLHEAISTFEAPEDVAAGIMGLLSVLLETTYSTAKVSKGEQIAQHLCHSILDDLNSGLDADRNIINCVADLMEQQLQSPGRTSMASSGHGTLISCIDFFSIYSKIQPQQAWSVLLRSSAFGARGTRPSLPSLIASIEVPSQDFKLLESCSELYEVIIDLMLVISFKDEDTNQLPTDLKTSHRSPSQRFNGAALLAYSETMYAAFESMTAWIFNSKQQKERITSHLASAFFKLLYYVFGTGESLEAVTSLSASLLPAATFVGQMLREADATSTGTGPLMSILVSAVLDQVSGDSFSCSNSLHCGPVLSLANLLVQYSPQPAEDATEVGLNLLNLVPVLTRLPLSNANLWAMCHAVLSSLLSRSSSSLLGHLGSASCVSFLNCLKHASQATIDPSVKSQMWDLLSRLVTIDQQWFAIVLITGSPPGREYKDGHSPKLQTRGKPILEIALDLLTNIDELDPGVSAGLLSFVGEAQQNWPSVTDSIASRPELFPHLIKYVSSRHSYNVNGIDQALHNKVAAGVTDLAVIHLHRLLVLKNEKVFVTFIPLLNWLTTTAVEVAAYNASLHANLKKNFAMKYRGLDVTSMKRTGLLKVPYGDTYFYDISLGDKILSGDPYWNNEKRNQTFFSEFQRANLNLAVVDSEFTLLRSLARLCVEHGKFFSRNRDVARIMAQIARHCLIANMQVTPPEALFDSLFQTRADLAVVLVRPLAAAGYRGSDYSALLTAAWDATRFRNGSYEMAIANDDLVYWRSMLSVLLMSMQFRVERKLKHANVAGDRSIEQIDPYNGMFCEIAVKVVGEGLKSVVLALQEQNQKQQRNERARNTDASVRSSTVGVKDVSLLLSLLQTTLRLPSLPQFVVQLSEALIGTGTSRSALLLYSWSHILLESGQPVYSDLAAQFLASMSSLPRVAEELAVEGVMNRLLTARATQILQNIPSGAGHLDSRPNAPVLYEVWSQGLLPLCLNLLHGVGGGVAGEVSGFLNMFSSQLTRASMALAITPNPSTDGTGAGTGMVTMKLANEISSLSLISFILTGYRDAGASAGVDPSMIAELLGWDEHKRSIAEDVRDFLGQEYGARRRREAVQDERERMLQGSLRRSGDGGKAMVGDAFDDRIRKALEGVVECLLGEEGAGNGEAQDGLTGTTGA